MIRCFRPLGLLLVALAPALAHGQEAPLAKDVFKDASGPSCAADLQGLDVGSGSASEREMARALVLACLQNFRPHALGPLQGLVAALDIDVAGLVAAESQADRSACGSDPACAARRFDRDRMARLGIEAIERAFAADPQAANELLRRILGERPRPN